MEQYKMKIRKMNIILCIVDIVLLILVLIINKFNIGIIIASFQLFSIPQIIFGNFLADYILLKNKLTHNVIEKDESNTRKFRKAKKNTIISGLVSIIYFIIINFFMLVIMGNTAYKPIIYIYPEEKKDISITLPCYNKLICSYPKYINGWNVIAEPNGDLTEIGTNKQLYSLYYESKSKYTLNENSDNGFVVNGENSAEFLEEKLSILGLNYKEKEEFIIYWLPKLEANKYNFIRFASLEEIEKQMPIVINPKPNTLIRVMMIYKKLDSYKYVSEQKLEPVTRQGYTVVEWGGTELK